MVREWSEKPTIEVRFLIGAPKYMKKKIMSEKDLLEKFGKPLTEKEKEDFYLSICKPLFFVRVVDDK